MVTWTPGEDGDRMPESLYTGHDIADSAHELQRAASAFHTRASSRETVPALPSALADLEEALNRLAAGMAKTAHALEAWAGTTDVDIDRDTLPPDARALRWHLSHIAVRLRGAQDACPEARRWAHTLLAAHADQYRSLSPAHHGDSL
jgi:hypothetical protein